MAPSPITDSDRARVRELHEQGKTRNDTARTLGRSPSTVSRIARELGLSYDRSKTAAASAAKAVDNRARRIVLESRALSRAEALYDRLEADRYRFTATTVNGIETRTLDHVPAQDERHLSGAAAAHIATAAKLAEANASGQAEAARSMLGNLAEALGIKSQGAGHQD